MEKKLEAGDVRFIRTCDRSLRQLADDYGVSLGVIQRVRNRLTYRDVPEGAPGTPNNQYVIGDTLDLLRALPDAYCPTIFTSPPYNKGQSHSATKGRNSNWRASELLQNGFAEGGDDMPPEVYIQWQRELLAEMVRVAGPWQGWCSTITSSGNAIYAWTPDTPLLTGLRCAKLLFGIGVAA